MPTINAVLQSRSVSGGHAIEVDFQLTDGSVHTLRLPFERIPFVMHAITNAASVAEATQRAEARDRSVAVIVPYLAGDLRTGSSPDGTVVAEFARRKVQCKLP